VSVKVAASFVYRELRANEAAVTFTSFQNCKTSAKLMVHLE